MNVVEYGVYDRNLAEFILGDVDHCGSSHNKLGFGVVEGGHMGGHFIPLALEFSRYILI